MRISDWSSDVCSSDLRHREADTRLLRQESGNRRRVAGALLVPEREDPQALALHETAKVGDRNAGHAIDRVDAVELQGVDDEVKAVGQRLRCAGLAHVGVNALCCY